MSEMPGGGYALPGLQVLHAFVGPCKRSAAGQPVNRFTG